MREQNRVVQDSRFYLISRFLHAVAQVEQHWLLPIAAAMLLSISRLASLAVTVTIFSATCIIARKADQRQLDGNPSRSIVLLFTIGVCQFGSCLCLLSYHYDLLVDILFSCVITALYALTLFVKHCTIGTKRVPTSALAIALVAGFLKLRTYFETQHPGNVGGSDSINNYNSILHALQFLHITGMPSIMIVALLTVTIWCTETLRTDPKTRLSRFDAYIGLLDRRFKLSNTLVTNAGHTKTNSSKPDPRNEKRLRTSNYVLKTRRRGRAEQGE